MKSELLKAQEIKDSLQQIKKSVNDALVLESAIRCLAIAYETSIDEINVLLNDLKKKGWSNESIHRSVTLTAAMKRKEFSMAQTIKLINGY
ncbi:hypothetical protein [Azotobacter beijerinckii]|uniref:hypothetical protein n=1 Tax=Azotobacter beijerinckii TaxID=170623 RepID=UPI0029559CDC|nr:hypothetical protein [Azotobacter beijerinckii]